MLRIFKYEIRRRRNTIFIFAGAMTVLALGSLMLLFFRGNSIGSFVIRSSGTEVLWYGITMFSLMFIPAVMFFTCSNGHIDELLYKDTNYLMLTIPVKSEAILGGRLLAGLAEFLIYGTISVVFFVIFMAWGANASFSSMSFSSTLDIILKNIFIYNFKALLYANFAGLSCFLVIGNGFMFVKALTRSFIRKKKIAHITSVGLFLFIFYWISLFGEYLSQEWNLVQTLRLTWAPAEEVTAVTNDFLNIEIHLITNVLLFIMSILFFTATNWLFNKKVEL